PPYPEARVGQLIDGAFGKALISLSVADGDQPGLMQAFNGLVQTRALRQVDDLVLAPQLHAPLHLVGVERSTEEHEQHGQGERRWAGWRAGGHQRLSLAHSGLTA